MASAEARGVGVASDAPGAWRGVARLIVPLYLAALTVLLAKGHTGLVLLLVGNAALLALLVWLTGRMTRPPATAAPEPPASSATLPWQLLVLAVVVAVTGVASTSVPLWSAVVAWSRAVGEALLSVAWFGGPGNAVANPVQYMVIPLAVLLVLGARPAGLGLRRGRHAAKVSILWAVLPAVVALVAVAMGALSPQGLVRRVLGNTFQNGFFEEFLFRGALQTRLRLVVAAPWAIAVQALVFGVWHLRATTAGMGGDPVAGLALCIASQVVAGLAFGYVFHRTGSLIAPSVAHVALNVLGQTVG
jgi:membrane protease YdiL (CAAX protease family)